MAYSLFGAGFQSTPEDTRFTRERLVNLHLTQAPPLGGSAPGLIRQTHGLKSWLLPPLIGTIEGPILAMKAVGDSLYFLSVSEQTAQVYPGIASTNGTVSLGPNGVGNLALRPHNKQTVRTFIEVMGNAVFALTDGGYGASWNTSAETSIASITSPGSLAFLDNYMLAHDNDTRVLAWSNVGNGSSWNALDFASAESSNDNIERILVDHSEVWVFKQQRTEIWTITTESDSALRFQRINGGVIERGLSGRMTPAKYNNLVYFVGDDKVVYAVDIQSQPMRISNTAVERVLASYTNLESFVGYTWKEAGHRFYALRPPDRPALVYDIDLGFWHERSSGTNEEPYMVLCTTTFAGKELAGCSDGTIREFAADTYQDGSISVARDLYTAPLLDGSRRLRLHEVTLDLRGGDVSLGRDPVCMMRLSTDGSTWGPWINRTFGDLGTHQRVTRWHKLGQARRFDAHFRITDPVPVSINGGEYRIS